jgi:hypothetical protein
VIVVVTAVVVTTAVRMFAVILIVAQSITNQAVVSTDVVATLISNGVVLVPLQATHDITAAIFVVAVIRIRMLARAITKQPLIVTTFLPGLLSPLAAVLRQAAHTNVEASEVTGICRILRLLMLLWALLSVIVPPETAIVVAAAELVRAQVLKIITLGILDQRIVAILDMAFLPCRGMLVMPLSTGDDIPATLVLAAAALLRTIIEAKDILQQHLICTTVMRSQLVPALARWRVTAHAIVMAIKATVIGQLRNNEIGLVTLILVVIIPVAAVVVPAAHMVSTVLITITSVITDQSQLLALLVIRCHIEVPLHARDD